MYRLILSFLPSFADGKLITTCRGDPGNTFFLSFAGDTNGKFNFVTGGVRHMRFWNVTGHTMKSKKCILGQNVRAMLLMVLVLIVLHCFEHRSNIDTAHVVGITFLKVP